MSQQAAAFMAFAWTPNSAPSTLNSEPCRVLVLELVPLVAAVAVAGSGSGSGSSTLDRKFNGTGGLV